jgi:hypothetical protein
VTMHVCNQELKYILNLYHYISVKPRSFFVKRAKACFERLCMFFVGKIMHPYTIYIPFGYVAKSHELLKIPSYHLNLRFH